MTTASWDGPERREFFRLNEEVHLNYQVLTEEEYQAQLQGEDGEESNSAQISQLRELSYQSENLLAGSRKNQPELSQYLSLLEKRLSIFTTCWKAIVWDGGWNPTVESISVPEAWHSFPENPLHREISLRCD